MVNNDVSSLWVQFKKSANSASIVWLLFAICLVPVNWGLEVMKWRILTKPFQSLSVNGAIKSVMAGVSLAIITPGRIGEYGGRLIGILPEHRPKAILANLISSIGQNVINIGIGLIASILFLNSFLQIESSIFVSVLMVGFVLVSVLLVLLYRLDLIGGILAYLPKHKYVDKVVESVSAFSEIKRSSLNKILGLSAVRYATYTAQYVLLLFFFGVMKNVWIAVLGVCTIFFFQSNLPLPAAFSVLVRGEMAIYLWSTFTDNVLGILAATFCLWVINLVIPALVGALIISQEELK